MAKRIPSMRKHATIEVKSNLSLVARERGKIVERREGHNIWVALGSEYLAHIIAYPSMSPLTTIRDDRVRYMGVGMGGTRQLALPTANASPLVAPYPGTNAQTDADETVQRLERPVRMTGGSSNFPYSPTDEWLAQVQAPPTFPDATSITFRRLIQENEVSYGVFDIVPLSEVGLFTNAANPNVYNNTLLAYDTFATLSKTEKVAIEISWTLRFA